LIIPSTWTSAKIVILVDDDNSGTFVPLCNGSGEYDLTVTAGTTVALDPNTVRNVNNIKLQSGVTGSLVDQVDALSVGIICGQ
jgi:hypothetical protein